MENKLASVVLVFLGLFVTAQCSTTGNEGRVIQTFLQWNYTHFNENCTTASGRTFCKDIRICKFAAASLVMGGWPTMCGWVDNVVPKVCCGFPLVLGGALLRKVDEEKARKRECGKTLWSPGLSETENNFFKLVHDLPYVNTSDPTRFDPPIDFSIQTMVSPVGGVSSRQGDFPWMVSIRKNGKHLCGGSLIDRSHVLSAAHCFDSRDTLDPSRYTVHIGNIRVNEGYPVKVKNIVVHEDYIPKQYYHDIAMLTLDKEILSPYVAHICLPSPQIAVRNLTGSNTSLLGWGHTSFGGRGTSVLHIVDNIPVVTTKKCREAYLQVAQGSLPRGVTNDFLCAGFEEGGKDACQSDSGGPLMYKENPEDSDSPWVLVGIVSFEAREIVNDRTPKPGFSYSSALNSTIAPSEPNTPQNSQRAPKVINSIPATPAIVDPIADKDTITVKKSDWLALLAIKRSWEETSSPATKKPKRRRDLQEGKTPKPPPKENKIQIEEKEDQLKIHPSEESISEMDDDIADSDPSRISPEYFKSNFFKNPNNGNPINLLEL
ncbi:Clotting factor B [Araneus ventricosus]|uniref:Clotting factor B n=1 Tax=Araneus ventricosus TaxID=182803 RepID=A0A4Y2MW32_ARAVE|nr:Clotting factor B [Araneus ventricosus]